MCPECSRVPASRPRQGNSSSLALCCFQVWVQREKENVQIIWNHMDYHGDLGHHFDSFFCPGYSAITTRSRSNFSAWSYHRPNIFSLDLTSLTIPVKWDPLPKLCFSCTLNYDKHVRWSSTFLNKMVGRMLLTYHMWVPRHTIFKLVA